MEKHNQIFALNFRGFWFRFLYLKSSYYFYRFDAVFRVGISMINIIYYTTYLTYQNKEILSIFVRKICVFSFFKSYIKKNMIVKK